MGAPNIVRGGSHSGNVSALELAKADLLDILSSDYVPSSLLTAVFELVNKAGWKLPRAMVEEKLRQELPQIFRWMINGCLDWQAEGIARPDIAVADTGEYFADQDALGRWLATECESEAETIPADHACKTKFFQLFGSWKTWCKENGEEEGSGKSFSQALVKRGHEKDRESAGVVFLRIKLRQPATQKRKDTDGGDD